MSAGITGMRKHISLIRKQYAFLLAKSTEINTRSTEMRKHISLMRKQYAFLLAKSTEMRKQLGILRKHISLMRKQYAFLFIEINLNHFPDAVSSYGDRKNLTLKMGITEYSNRL